MSNITSKSQPVDISGVLALPPGHNKRKEVEKILDQVALIIKGFLVRQRYRKMRFIYRVTGKKAHEISDDDLYSLP